MKRFTIVFLLIALISFSLAASGKSSDSMMMEGEDTGEMDTMAEDSMDSDKEMDSSPMGPVMDFPGLEMAQKTAEDTPTVLFFHASWCPTCKAAMKDLEMNLSMLEGIQIYIVDYDTTKDLQKKYGVTYQHTFVQIDSMGKNITTWNGGGTDEILQNTMMKEM